ncbi:hypothetical protein AAG570_000727 [Ranatra chinensis]|uniref:alpha-glucosidase n=1 Tax=Ranatra chinensis TaxID=642074 RepID=A0ABD0YXY2_9HEMI
MNLGLLFLVFAAAYAADDLPWWKTEVFYQIYPRSFKDSNKDGIGDLQGITDNVDYLKSLGIGAIWLSPIYASPNADYGYDVSDYKNINKEYGDMDSFKKLMTKLNDKKIKLIMDFIPNHTSEKHPWFLQSKNRTAGYEDYYIWKDGVGVKKSPPTNWVKQLSMDGSSAWQWCEERNQYYYHVFSPSQPDLNYSNPKVLEEMKGVMDFWLHEGVSGFRMDAVPYLVETDFKDENKICSDPIYDCLNHTYTKDTESTHAILHEFTQHLEKYKEDNNLTTLVLEATSPMDQIVKYYDNDTIPFNFNLMGLKENSSAGEFVNQIKSWIDGVTDERWSNWFTGNHDSQRAASRFDRDLTDALNMIIMLLPGTPFTYYGEEIAMKDVELKNFTDIRMKSRTPFQWDGTPHAGELAL